MAGVAWALMFHALAPWAKGPCVKFATIGNISKASMTDSATERRALSLSLQGVGVLPKSNLVLHRVEPTLLYPPWGVNQGLMSDFDRHTSHRGIVKRLKRADGHLRHVIGMIEDGRPCTDIAVQLQAVEKAVTAAKRTLIHDHIDHCLVSQDGTDLAEMKALAKLL